MDVDTEALLEAIESARQDRVSPAFLEELTVSRSLHARLGQTADEAPLGAVRRWLRWLALDEEPNVAFVDTTLVHTVARLTLGELGPGDVNAPTVMDLCAFASAAILCESVVHLPNAGDSLALNEALGDPLLVALPVVEFDAADDPASMPAHASAGREYEQGLHGVAATLGNLLEDAATEVRRVTAARPGDLYHGDAVAMAEQWGAVLGRPIGIDELRYDGEWGSWDSDGPGLLRKLLDFQHDELDSWAVSPEWMRQLTEDDPDEGLEVFISECNTRSFFNLRVAELLGVPYVGNTTRLPIRGHQYKRAAFTHRQLLLAGELDAHVDEHVAEFYAPTATNLRLPVFGALALRDAESPRDVLRRIGELWAQAASFRAHRVEYDEALRTGADARTVEALRRAITDDGERLISHLAGPAAAGVAAVLAAAAGPTTMLAIAAIGLLSTAATLPAASRRSVRQRLLRPTHWWLTSTTHTAEAIASSAGDVQRVFSLDDRSVDTIRRRMGELAAVELL